MSDYLIYFESGLTKIQHLWIFKRRLFSEFNINLSEFVKNDQKVTKIIEYVQRKGVKYWVNFILVEN